MQIVFDISANNHRNDWDTLKLMIDSIIGIDNGKHKIIFKHQLFESEGENRPLDRSLFEKAFHYAWDKGYRSTASVFDESSAEYLLRFNVPFIKIACNPAKYYLLKYAEEKLFMVSINSKVFDGLVRANIRAMWCVPKYPATYDEYLPIPENICSISDHTEGLRLVNTFNPNTWEKHLKLPGMTGLDAGTFAITPEELKEIL